MEAESAPLIAPFETTVRDPVTELPPEPSDVAPPNDATNATTEIVFDEILYRKEYKYDSNELGQICELVLDLCYEPNVSQNLELLRIAQKYLLLWLMTNNEQSAFDDFRNKTRDLSCLPTSPQQLMNDSRKLRAIVAALHRHIADAKIPMILENLANLGQTFRGGYTLQALADVDWKWHRFNWSQLNSIVEAVVFVCMQAVTHTFFLPNAELETEDRILKFLSSLPVESRLLHSLLLTFKNTFYGSEKDQAYLLRLLPHRFVQDEDGKSINLVNLGSVLPSKYLAYRELKDLLFLPLNVEHCDDMVQILKSNLQSDEDSVGRLVLKWQGICPALKTLQATLTSES